MQGRAYTLVLELILRLGLVLVLVLERFWAFHEATSKQ